MLETMRKASIIISAIALCAAGLFAQDELAQYQTWMKAAAGANMGLRKGVTEKNADAVKENSVKMADAFDQMSKFWAGKHNDAAAGFAATARDAAKAVGGGDESALAKIGPTCQGCHAITRAGNDFKK